MDRPTDTPIPHGETETERRLVEEVRRVCGSLLSTFLLAGYGREEPARCHSFGVTARDDLGPSGLRIVQAYGGDGGLPAGREPLVWAALLRELFRAAGGAREVATHHRRVLEDLGWENTAEGRTFVQRALVKYADVTVVEVRTPRHGAKDQREPIRISRLHPVVEYGAALPRGEVGEDASFRVEFSGSFAAGLTSGGLFGAVWEEV